MFVPHFEDDDEDDGSLPEGSPADLYRCGQCDGLGAIEGDVNDMDVVAAVLGYERIDPNSGKPYSAYPGD